MTDSPQTPVQNIWQNQPVEGVQMSIEVIRKRAAKFEHKIVWRNVREYLSSLAAAMLFAGFFTRTHDVLIRIAYLLFIAGLAWVVIQLHRKGSAKSLPVEMGASASLQYFRAELERQRDVVQNVWSWYLAPLVPGFVFLSFGYVRSMPHPKGLLAAAILDVFVAALFFGVWRMNMRAARCLQRKIDELYAIEK
jgi:hypothetical protein